MRLKSFYAKTLTEAMHMIRETLGEDAVIVATREENGGKAVRVTAAIDPTAYADGYGDAPARTDPHFEVGAVRSGGDTGATSSESWLQYDLEQDTDENSIAEGLTDVMLAHSVPEDVTDQVLSCAMVVGYRDMASALEDSLDHLYQYRPILSARPSTKPIILVGPPGVGKTMMVAKLATRSVMNGHRPTVITADTHRAGGMEQLSALTRILKIDLKRVKSPPELARAVAEARGNGGPIFVDTAGTLPYDTDDIRDLARFLAAVDADPVLALPAGMDATESGEIGRIFATLGVAHLISTRMDVGRRLGGILAAAHQGGLALAESSFSPKVAEGLGPMTPRRLTEYLLAKKKRSASSARPAPLTSAPLTRPIHTAPKVSLQRSTSG